MTKETISENRRAEGASFRDRRSSDFGRGFKAFGSNNCLIPTVIDQNPCAHLRMPRDMIFHGLVDEVFPGLAAQRDDVFVGFEDPVRLTCSPKTGPILKGGSVRLMFTRTRRTENAQVTV